jgi:hypothetical protein
MSKNKEEKILEKERNGEILKDFEVKIVQAFADGTGVVFGLGNDQKIYVWHHSLYYAGNWVLHVKEKNNKI